VTIKPGATVFRYGVVFYCLVVTITTVNNKPIIIQLEADGWFLARVKGSHHQFKHPDSDIPAGTLNNIHKQVGWK